MDSTACHRPDRLGIGLVQVRHDRVDFPNPLVWKARPRQRSRHAHEFPGTERAGTAEVRLRAPRNKFAQAFHVVVMPMCRHDQANGTGGIQPECVEVLEGYRPFAWRPERVQDDPIAPARMHDGAFAISRPEQRDFRLIGVGRISLSQDSTWRAGDPPNPGRPSGRARSCEVSSGKRFARRCFAFHL